MKDLLNGYPDLLDYLELHVDSKHHHFARYMINIYPGNHFRMGDAPAEQNHSSYVQRIGPTSSVEPAEALVSMLERQADILKEKDMVIAKYHLQCTAQVSLLWNKNNSFFA